MKLGELDELMGTLVDNHPVETLDEAEVIVLLPNEIVSHPVKEVTYDEHANIITFKA